MRQGPHLQRVRELRTGSRCGRKARQGKRQGLQPQQTATPADQAACPICRCPPSPGCPEVQQHWHGALLHQLLKGGVRHHASACRAHDQRVDAGTTGQKSAGRGSLSASPPAVLTPSLANTRRDRAALAFCSLQGAASCTRCALAALAGATRPAMQD